MSSAEPRRRPVSCRLRYNHAMAHRRERTNKPGLLLVISGPSGVGKTTITHAVEQRLGGVFSVSMTTRPKTDKDVDGRDYFFVSPAKFKAARDAGELLEWAEVFGHYYGTPRSFVEQHLDEGKLVILEIDVAGAEQVRQQMPDCYAVFVLPPTDEELLKRLRRRQREDESVIQRRFAEAKREIERAKSGGTYDEFIVNDNLDEAIGTAVQLVRQRLDHHAAA